MNTLDYLTTTTWTNMALFFEVKDSQKRFASASFPTRVLLTAEKDSCCCVKRRPGMGS